MGDGRRDGVTRTRVGSPARRGLHLVLMSRSRRAKVRALPVAKSLRRAKVRASQIAKVSRCVKVKTSWHAKVSRCMKVWTLWRAKASRCVKVRTLWRAKFRASRRSGPYGAPHFSLPTTS